MAENGPTPPPPITPQPPTVVYVTTTTTTTTMGSPRNFSGRWRNRPQRNATVAACMIFASAGLNMALGLSWSGTRLYERSKQFWYSWFIGVIIGTLLSAVLRIFISKKLIMATSAVLILIGGFIFVSVPYDYDPLLAGRYINGIAIGLSIVQFFLHTSEVAADAYRGKCLLREQYFVTFGIMVQMIYASYWNSNFYFPANRVHGMFDIIFALFTFVFLLLYIESPIEHIRRGDDDAALACLSRLKRPPGITAKTRARLEQQKAYVREQENLSILESLRQGCVPLVKMLFYRSMMLAFCFSMPLNISLQYSISWNGQIWAATVAGACRFLGSFITFLLADHVNRRMLSVIPLLFIGCLLVGLGSVFHSLNNIYSYSFMNAAMSMYIILQAFAGFFTPFTSIYMGEAFPLRVKPYLMDVCVIVEQLIQIIFIETLSVYIGDNLIAQGLITLVLFLFLFFMMPETRNTSLAEAQRRFRKLRST